MGGCFVWGEEVCWRARIAQHSCLAIRKCLEKGFCRLQYQYCEDECLYGAINQLW